MNEREITQLEVGVGAWAIADLQCEDLEVHHFDDARACLEAARKVDPLVARITALEAERDELRYRLDSLRH